MDASVFHWESVTLVSHKTRIVECGVFRIGDPGSATIILHFIFMSKWIVPSSSVNPKIVLD